MHPELFPPDYLAFKARTYTVLPPQSGNTGRLLSIFFYEPYLPSLLISASLNLIYGEISGHRPRYSGDRVAAKGYLLKFERAIQKKEKPKGKGAR